MFARMKTYVLTLMILLAALPTAAAEGVADDLYKQLSKLDSRRLYDKGYQYIRNGENDKALTCYTIVADRMDPRDSVSVRLAVGSMGNIAYIYSVNEFGKSFVYLDKALKTAEQYKVKDKLPFLYLNMANVMHADETVRTPDRMSALTLDCYRKAYDAALAVGDWGPLLDALNNVVSIAIGCRQLHDVKWLINNFRSLNIPEGTADLRFSRLHCDAAEALMNGDTARALGSLERMKGTETAEGDVRAMLQVWADVANTYYHMGDYVRCVAADTTAIGIARRHGQRDVAVSFYENLVKCYKALGDKELYRRYYLIYLEQKDSMYYQNQLLDVEHLRFTSELEEVNGRMKTLAAEKRNQQLVARGAVKGARGEKAAHGTVRAAARRAEGNRRPKPHHRGDRRGFQARSRRAGAQIPLQPHRRGRERRDNGAHNAGDGERRRDLPRGLLGAAAVGTRRMEVQLRGPSALREVQQELQHHAIRIPHTRGVQASRRPRALRQLHHRGHSAERGLQVAHQLHPAFQEGDRPLAVGIREDDETGCRMSESHVNLNQNKKGGISRCERRPTERRKAANCVAICRLFVSR